MGTAIPGKRWDFAVPLPSRLPAKITGAFNSGTHPTGWKWWVEGCVLAGFDDYPIRLQHHPTFKAGCHVACLHASQGLPVPSRLSDSHGCGLARKKRWKGQTKKAGCHRGQPLPSRIISSGLTASHEKYLTYKWWRPSVKFLARSETGKNIDEFIFFGSGEDTRTIVVVNRQTDRICWVAGM